MTEREFIKRESYMNRISQRELGEELGIDQPGMSRLLNGGSMRFERFARICEVLGVEITLEARGRTYHVKDGEIYG